MSRSINAALALAIAVLACGAGAAPPAMPGRPATAQEVAAWDIDVRPDFTGLPKGSGSVLAGQAVWEGKCASCHGTFGESNEVFTPLIGGTTAADAASGRVASLVSGRQPQKTTLMKLATVSTLWDYINRAMPWTAPKSLTTDEVYAVTAYMLNMGEVVPDDFVLSDRTMAQAQQRMPNRKGMVSKHGLWDIKGKPDVKSVACMTHCPVEATVRSSLPDGARNAHGNLAQQTRGFGATRGVDTTQAGPTARLAAVAPAVATAPASGPGKATLGLLQQHACMACHALDTKVVGPSFKAVREKYQGDSAAAARLADKIRQGSAGTWGPIPMPAQGQGQVTDADLAAMLAWILATP
ncbi:c-type cytochrome [Massilia sp. DJPM01]|uniref:c-type cytochrome n=1 Tax=Massilia sp. DJPM01 TaxID=3024404 RepID=UPI00259DD2AA|nr:c-type cytochrome [Massilia sp. DJPM01]MDM5181602.1 c-type cytochrome [Massilia sp. DJPM01]